MPWLQQADPFSPPLPSTGARAPWNVGASNGHSPTVLRGNGRRSRRDARGETDAAMKKIFGFKRKKKEAPPERGASDSAVSAASATASLTAGGYDVRSKDLSKLHKAAATGDLQKLKQLAFKRDLNQLDRCNRWARPQPRLHTASRAGGPSSGHPAGPQSVSGYGYGTVQPTLCTIYTHTERQIYIDSI